MCQPYIESATALSDIYIYICFHNRMWHPTVVQGHMCHPAVEKLMKINQKKGADKIWLIL